MNDIGRNLSDIRTKLARVTSDSGREPLLIAVSKTVDVPRILMAIDAGVTDLGENRVQEAQAKFPEIGRRVRWHLIGHLQSNKVRKAAELFDVIHTVDSTGLGDRLSSACLDLGRRPDVLVQVNVDDDDSKEGVRPGAVAGLLGHLGGLPGFRVTGLMTIGKLVGTPEEARGTFRRLASLARELRAAAIPGVVLEELSMGMSADFAEAVEEGSTMVRVGSALFGSR